MHCLSIVVYVESVKLLCCFGSCDTCDNSYEVEHNTMSYVFENEMNTIAAIAKNHCYWYV